MEKVLYFVKFLSLIDWSAICELNGKENVESIELSMLLLSLIALMFE